MQLTDFGMDSTTLAGSLPARLRAVREAGFAQVMLSAQDLVNHPDGPQAAIDAVRASGLRVTGLKALRDFEGLAAPLHAYKVDVAKSMLRLAHAVGARLLLVCASTSAHASGDDDAIVADLRKLATLAVPLGVRIGYEPLPWARHVRDLARAAHLVERADRANLGLALDAFHLLATATPPQAVDDLDARKLFFVQLSDSMWQPAPAEPERIEAAARHCRVFPGEGVHHPELIELVRRLDLLGYWGDWSFEVVNDDYLQMPPAEVAARAQRAVRWIVDHVPLRSLPVRSLVRPGTRP